MRAHVICIVDSRTIRGVSWNLSQGGMVVEVSDLRPENAVRLSFRLPVSGVSEGGGFATDFVHKLKRVGAALGMAVPCAVSQNHDALCKARRFTSPERIDGLDLA